MSRRRCKSIRLYSVCSACGIFNGKHTVFCKSWAPWWQRAY